MQHTSNKNTSYNICQWNPCQEQSQGKIKLPQRRYAEVILDSVITTNHNITVTNDASVISTVSHNTKSNVLK